MVCAVFAAKVIYKTMPPPLDRRLGWTLLSGRGCVNKRLRLQVRTCHTQRGGQNTWAGLHLIRHKRTGTDPRPRGHARHSAWRGFNSGGSRFTTPHSPRGHSRVQTTVGASAFSLRPSDPPALRIPPPGSARRESSRLIVAFICRLGQPSPPATRSIWGHAETLLVYGSFVDEVSLHLASEVPCRAAKESNIDRAKRVVDRRNEERVTREEEAR